VLYMVMLYYYIDRY